MSGLRKFTRENQAAVLGAMKAGAGFPRAMVLAGLTYETGRLWRKAAEEADAHGDEDSELVRFFAKVNAIVADRIAKAEGVMHAAVAAGDVKAAMWVLERLAPEEYSTRVAVQPVLPGEPEAPKRLTGASTRELEESLQ